MYSIRHYLTLLLLNSLFLHGLYHVEFQVFVAVILLDLFTAVSLESRTPCHGRW